MSGKDVLDEYREIYVDEARENLAVLNNLVLKLEKNPDDVETIEEIFRRIHLLKGSSAMLGVESVAEVAHRVEDLLTKVKSGDLKVNPELIDLLLESLDSISNAVELYSKGANVQIPSTLLEKLRNIQETSIAENTELSCTTKILENLDKEELQHLQSVLAEDRCVYLVKVRISAGGLAPIRAFKVLQKLGDGGEVIKTIPEGEKIAEGKFTGDLQILVVHKKHLDIQKLLGEIPDLEAVECTEISTEGLASLTSRSRSPISREEKAGTLERVESLIKKVEEVLQVKKSASLSGGEFVSGFRNIDEVKVKVKDLDRIFTLIGELVLVRNRLLRIESLYDDQEIKDAVASLNQTTNDLYAEILKMRLISVGQVFNAFPRLVRDLARQLGKEVDFVIEGEDTTLDRRILEELVDPLIGLIRNAIDHGVESPEERLSAGKPRVATVRLSAKREGEFTVISVEDDGRGIDIEEVKRIAVKKGIIPRHMAAKLSEKEVLDVIFLPGFSTRDSASMVSGRGMGLNAVKRKVESLGGYVTIQSKKGRGTKVMIAVPSDISIITVLLVEVAGQIYAIQLSSIVAVIELSDKKTGYARKQPLILFRDQVIPLYRLSDLLELDSKQPAKYGVILKKGDKLYCIAIHKPLGFEDVTVKSDINRIVKAPWISGVTILSNGEVALIVDPRHLIDKGEEKWSHS